MFWNRMVLTLFLFAAATFAVTGEPVLLFDLAHGQFQDVFVKPSYYDYVIPEYQKILKEIGCEYRENHEEITPDSLKDVKVLLMLSPLAKSTQKNIGEKEKTALVEFVRRGGRLILMVDEEKYRVNLKEYGANDVTKPFGIELGDDIHGLPGNCGAVSFENEIFGGRREVPYSGSRTLKGGIPASVCMEQGYLHASYAVTPKGGKIYVIGEAMVGLLMGYPDGERNIHKKMQTRWWGKDSHLYMKELLVWMLKD